MKKLADTHTSLMMYSHDGYGLGHLKRNCNIAKQVVKELPRWQALLLMGQTSVPFLPVTQRMDFLKLPSIKKVKNNQWESRMLFMGSEDIINLRKSLIYNSIEHYLPDYFIVDFHPKGAGGELIPALKRLKEKRDSTQVILGLRDILHKPEVTRKIWEKEGVYDVIRNYYDKIFIYGNPQIFDTAYHYGLTGDLEKKVYYCGYVSGDEPSRPPDQVRKALGVDKEKLIVVTAGGGKDGYPMMQRCMDALQAIKDDLSVECLFITGPNMEADQWQFLQVQANQLPAKIKVYSEEVIDYMNASDLLITMGGYNTMVEAVGLQRPTLIIPRKDHGEEQIIRANLFSRLGLVTALDPVSSLSETTLSKAILDTLCQGSTTRIPFNKNGLKNIIRHLSCEPSKADAISHPLREKMVV